ncbi:DNA mismatch repair protein MutL [Candidatus Kinetoplastibacterium sorsogonicusi]|uniref:DNA mismatch repair protein MutL n=1 Tax=Candidatus Kinetoplastidibacterium kentomonadis TaxID=1576550 RepID=A0A3S7JAE5_9PROT|nr:DNA mismatch repair endonuclease MutL [Candidatus Kinetoplastibacterium sorsogonicusi]AWD32643.1 DNA mismatch repair protein MutL [Candidatus Kinetoplastibacterium sorsogonicusi]
MIKRLPIIEMSDTLSNQIAAGEIIHRPSSILKEIIENSIDAYADSIDIYLEHGGKNRIIVKDNGYGIEKNELYLAIKKHSTNKIYKIEDLETISSMGFRGEALASINTIADIIIITRTQSDENSWKFDVKNNILKATHGFIGTTIEIKNIFHNIPARRKFLKSDNNELRNCLDIFEKIVLSFNDISFSLYHNKNLLYKYKKNIKEQRIKEILGGEFIQYSINIDHKSEFLNISGKIINPSFLDSIISKQYIYINNRFIKNRIISQAIQNAYKDVIYSKNKPSYIIFIEINSKYLDINVHPSKQEVHFYDSNHVYNIVKTCIETFLNKLNNIKNNKILYSNIKNDCNQFIPLLSQEETYNDKNHHLKNINIEKSIQNNLLEDNVSKYNLGTAIAQIHGIYILSQNQTGIILVDIHAAHERIIYEKMKIDFDNKKITQQNLLIPIIVNIPNKFLLVLEEHIQYINSIGFDIRIIGYNKLSILSIPSIIQNQDINKLMIEILSELYKLDNSYSFKEKIYKILANIACHNSLRANRKLNIEEMNNILRQMELTNKANQCNHGRPTWLYFSLKDIDKLFFRGK